MARPLETRHFKPQPRISLTSQPRFTKLASLMAETCGRVLSSLRSAPWQITADGIVDGAALPDGEGTFLRFESERGSLTAHLMFDRGAVSALLEAALGGMGGEAAFNMNERPLSKIENGLLRLSYAMLAKEFAAAFSQQLDRAFSLFDGKDQPELPANSTELAQFRFVVNVFSYSGELRFTVPKSELERQFLSSPDEAADATVFAQRHMLQQQVGKSEITLTVTLGPEVLSVETLAGLEPGKLVALTAAALSPVTVWSGGIAAFHGKLARSGDKLAVELTGPVT